MKIGLAMKDHVIDYQLRWTRNIVNNILFGGSSFREVTWNVENEVFDLKGLTIFETLRELHAS